MTTTESESRGSQATVTRKLRFAAVPDAVLEDCGLSFSARIVLAWALGRQDGFAVWIWYMCKQLGLSDKSWPRVRRELIAAGFFIQRREKGEDGKFIWKNEFTDQPLLSITAQAGSVGCDRGQAAPASPPVPPVPPVGAAPARARYQTSPDGVVYQPGNVRDEVALAAISNYQPDARAAAVAEAARRDKASVAYPAAVLAILRTSPDHKQAPPLSEAALAAQAARLTPPKGMGMTPAGGR